jgi:hypothetical protein
VKDDNSIIMLSKFIYILLYSLFLRGTYIIIKERCLEAGVHNDLLIDDTSLEEVTCNNHT